VCIDSTITPRQARATAGPKRNNRLGSEPASSVFDVDTSRSYANESVVFGDTTITTPGSISTMRTSRMSHLSGVPEEGVFTGAGRVRQLRAVGSSTPVHRHALMLSPGRAPPQGRAHAQRRARG
jgi:hypothetical protein